MENGWQPCLIKSRFLARARGAFLASFGFSGGSGVFEGFLDVYSRGWVEGCGSFALKREA